jgi:hypothetical protein
MNESERHDIEVREPQPETPHNAALYEAGKAMLVDSVTAGRDFCKFMVGVCTSAIPVYILLIGLIVGKEYRPRFGEGALLLAAPSTFLAGAVVFGLGLFPIGATVSLDLPEEVEAARESLLVRRRLMSVIGLSLFVVGTVLSLVGITYAIAAGLGPSKPSH